MSGKRLGRTLGTASSTTKRRPDQPQVAWTDACNLPTGIYFICLDVLSVFARPAVLSPEDAQAN